MHRAVLLLSALAVTACQPASQQRAVGMANPASVNCERIGGRLEIRDGAGGQTGYCHLPDGNVVEEWDLYRSGSK